MLNWCMIGRDATHDMRSTLAQIDSNNAREALKNQLDDELRVAGIHNVTTALGGSTSIDIYPNGWDKTYCLKHIDPERFVYFVGDKCHDSGNDRALYEHDRTVSYETTGPEKTMEIIDDIIKAIIDG